MGPLNQTARVETLRLDVSLLIYKMKITEVHENNTFKNVSVILVMGKTIYLGILFVFNLVFLG